MTKIEHIGIKVITNTCWKSTQARAELLHSKHTPFYNKHLEQCSHRKCHHLYISPSAIHLYPLPSTFISEHRPLYLNIPRTPPNQYWRGTTHEDLVKGLQCAPSILPPLIPIALKVATFQEHFWMNGPISRDTACCHKREFHPVIPLH